MKKISQLKLVRVFTLTIIISLFIFNPLIVHAEATDVKLEGPKSMKVGETKTLTTEVIKDDPDTDTNTYKLLFSSSNTDVATVDDSGKITAVKSGKASIVVQIENTTIQKTFEIVVEEEQVIEPPVVSNDNTLKSLVIEGYELDKTFAKDITNYEITIPTTVKSLKIKYERNDSKAQVMVTGNSSLKDGSIVRVVVTAEDKTTKTYEIKVNYEKVNLNLSSIKVLGQSLNETFKSTQTKYTLTVAYEITTLSIEAKPEDSNAKVEISGNDNLDVGTNTITITVKGKTSSDKKVYTIVVTREEETNNNKPSTSSNLSTEPTDEPSTSSKPSSNTTTNSGGSNMAKYVLVTIGCLVLFAIGGVGIYFYIKTAEPKNKKKNKIKRKEVPTRDTETSIENEPEIEDEYQVRQIYDYEEDVPNDDLEDTKEFSRDELTRNSQSRGTENSSKYDEDVLKDIEDLFDD